MNDYTRKLTDILDGLEGVRMDLETVESALDRLSFDLEEGRDILKEDGANALARSEWFQKVLPGDAAIFALAASAVTELIDRIDRDSAHLQAIVADAK